MNNIFTINCMFYQCSSLSFLPNDLKFNINKINQVVSVFKGCTNLINIPF
jgi:hypothetical protein